MKKQFYGIKFPFNEESDRKTFFDLNENKEDAIKSMILHIILTPKGQRLRMPDFGTDLIKFIFEPNESVTWENIKNEIVRQISKYLPEVIFNDIQIITNDEDNTDISVQINYSVNINGVIKNNNTVVKL